MGPHFLPRLRLMSFSSYHTQEDWRRFCLGRLDTRSPLKQLGKFVGGKGIRESLWRFLEDSISGIGEFVSKMTNSLEFALVVQRKRQPLQGFDPHFPFGMTPVFREEGVASILFSNNLGKIQETL